MDNHTIQNEKERIAKNSWFSKNQLEISKTNTGNIWIKIHMGKDYSTYTFGNKEMKQIENLGYDFEHFREGSYIIFEKVGD